MRKLSIREVSDLSGVSESNLRLWEKRYGWPNPPRNDSGYREYPKHLVQDIKRVDAIHKSGTPLGELIRDGLLYFPTKLAEKPHRPRYNFEKIPLPVSRQAQKIREELEQAILDGREGKIQEILAQKDLLRPSERECAITEVLRAAGRR